MRAYDDGVRDVLHRHGVAEDPVALDRWARDRFLTPGIHPGRVGEPYRFVLTNRHGQEVGAGAGSTMLRAWAAAVAEALERGDR